MVDSPAATGTFEALISEGNEKKCWGCGIRILLPSNTSHFRCGWCGAISNINAGVKHKDESLRWRCVRDRFFICIVSLFMLFIICGGVWASYPILFSISFSFGIFHSFVTSVLAITTLTTFSLAAFRPAGPPPNITWGSYPVVGKDELRDYSFCHYCLKPKSSRTHHCRSCGTCVLDMDHHCPFIGNCVGASNHRYFITFLISAIVSTLYASIMCSFAAYRTWPPLHSSNVLFLNNPYKFSSIHLATGLVKEIVFAVLNSLFLLSMRGVVLVYLSVASVSVQIGLCVLLWQQLCYIYEGETYLSQLSSSHMEGRVGERDCRNILQFFGCPYYVFRHLPVFRLSRKRHKK